MVRFTKGQTLVGIDEEDSDFSTVGKDGGEKEHVLTESEISSHSHSMSYATNWDGVKSSGWVIGTNSGSRVDKTRNIGGNSAHNNLQPYITVYYWKRIS